MSREVHMNARALAFANAAGHSPARDIVDKGMVIAGDIKINLVDIELLTIQIRLLICSVDKAKEMGIDWWTTNPYLKPGIEPEKSQVENLTARIAQLEEKLKPLEVRSVKAKKLKADQ